MKKYIYSFLFTFLTIILLIISVIKINLLTTAKILNYKEMNNVVSVKLILSTDNFNANYFYIDSQKIFRIDKNSQFHNNIEIVMNLEDFNNIKAKNIIVYGDCVPLFKFLALKSFLNKN